MPVRFVKAAYVAFLRVLDVVVMDEAVTVDFLRSDLSTFSGSEGGVIDCEIGSS